jgi:hypothetical protein
MRLFYYKCSCGEEFRNIVPDETDEEKIAQGFVKGPKLGTWIYYYNPNRKKVVPPVRTISCSNCGRSVEPSSDPKGVKTMILDNFMDLSD